MSKEINEKKKAVFVVFFVVVIMMMVGVVPAFIDTLIRNSFSNTTVDEILDSTAEFYSIVNDRKDITSGEFELWPRYGSRLEFTTDLETLKVNSRVRREIERHKVKIFKKCSISGTLSGDSRPINIQVLKNGDIVETEVLVRFAFSFDQNVLVETFEKLEALKKALDESTKKESTLSVRVKAVVADIEYSVFADWQDDLFEYYQRYNMDLSLSNLNGVVRIWLGWNMARNTSEFSQKRDHNSVVTKHYNFALSEKYAAKINDLNLLKQEEIGTVEIPVTITEINGIKL